MERNPSLFFKVNIGLPQLKPSRSDQFNQRQKTLQQLRQSKQSNSVEISLEDIRKEWLKTSAPFHIRAVAEHYNIYEDLFGDAFFLPRVPLTIKFKQPDGSSMPVYYGNQIKPIEVFLIEFCI